MFICLGFTEVIKHSLENWVLRLWNESFLSWFLFSLLLHQIASSNCKQHVTGTGISLFCPGVGTVYPWAMFLLDIPGTQCHYPNLKDLAVKRKSCQWSWIDIYSSDSLLLRSIYDKRQGEGRKWRKPAPPPPPPTISGTGSPPCIWRSGCATGVLSLLSQHFYRKERFQKEVLTLLPQLLIFPDINEPDRDAATISLQRMELFQS